LNYVSISRIQLCFISLSGNARVIIN